MNWTTVCRLEDIPPNAGVAALLGNRQIAVFRIDDAVYAIDNHDPFSGANVLARGIVGSINGRLCVASPLYKHHFDLGSGGCLEDSDVRVATYPARCQGDEVQLRA